MSDAFPDIRPHHLGISVPSLDEAIAWYAVMFGFELELRVFIDVIPAHVAFIRRGGFRIELFQVEGAAPLPPDRREPNLDVRTHGNKHICFQVSEVPAVVAGLRAKGADIVFEKVVQGTPMAFVRDNSGNLIELIQPARPGAVHWDKPMDRDAYDDYVRRFNAQDSSAFEEYLADDVLVVNGTLQYRGVQGMKDHYAGIWRTFSETLNVHRFVAGSDTLAVQLLTRFEARHDDPASLFGPVRTGDVFEFDGVVLYRIENGKFTEIRVAYNSFSRTDAASGLRTELGIPH
jgi:methylmalonyl-CoA/ethylmalonyl-CoA epimerase